MELSPNDQLHGFTVLTREVLPEIDGVAYVLSHQKSGARLLYLANDDTNKAFSIAFKTPPANDTGVFHILEHSVLCGSDKFPVKEPFVDLLKSSMQTFLNAMTFPDKTLYPVASTNDQDLMNLTDVYLDAVLHPAIYKKRAIFEQEGWHYELVSGVGSGDEDAGETPGVGEEDAAEVPGAGAADVVETSGVTEEDVAATTADTKGENETTSGTPSAANASISEDGTTVSHAQPKLVLNGVVYNEMKGALSDPNSVLYNELQAALFPDTAYRFESGGTPCAIPDLTYEEFLDEHARHYRLSNSYLTLYGNVDLDRMLAFINQKYLSPVADEEAARDAERAQTGEVPLEPHALELQAPVAAEHVVRNMDTAPENACAGLGYVMGSAHDRTRCVAVDILLDALMGSNEAPVKRALLDANLADDAQAFVADGMLQPFVVVQLRGSKPGAADHFRAAFEDALCTVAHGGIDRTLLEASLSRAEFVMRERDFGMADGVALSMAALSGWLYDDNMATTYLRYEEDFALLRRELNTDYFERLIREVFLESNHWALAEVRPQENAGNTYETKRLRAAEDAMGPDDFAHVAAAEAKLRRLQTESDTPEALATLPRLSVTDIGPALAEPIYGLTEGTPVPCIRHNIPTHGIVYTYRYFDLARVDYPNLPYAAILALVLGKLGTAKHTAAEIDTLINGQMGSLSFFSEVHESESDECDTLVPKFVVGASALSEKVEATCTLPLEIMLTTDFSDTSKIKDILQQKRISMEQGFAAAGHSAAMTRVASYYQPAGVVREQLGGVNFYLFLKDLLAHYDERAEELITRLAEVAECLFTDNGCIISFTGTDNDFERFWKAGAVTGRTGSALRDLHAPSPVVHNEAFIVPTDVCYAAQGFDRRADNIPYTGAWQVAARALSYDFLWNEVRVKGGAYGAGFGAARTGNLRFYSYRDPHLDETLERFAASAAWLEAFDPEPEVMEGYVVSTVAGFDAPLKARALARRQDGDYFAGRTPEARLATRTEMAATNAQAIRALASPLATAVAHEAKCVFGNKDIIEAAHTSFEVIDLLNE